LVLKDKIHGHSLVNKSIEKLWVRTYDGNRWVLAFSGGEMR